MHECTPKQTVRDAMSSMQTVKDTTPMLTVTEGSAPPPHTHKVCWGQILLCIIAVCKLISPQLGLTNNICMAQMLYKSMDYEPFVHSKPTPTPIITD